MIYRGTTPTHIFSFTFDPNDVSNLYITYVQKGKTIIEKTLDDVIFDEAEEIMSVSLTQEDTLAFTGATGKIKTVDSTVLIQIRILFNDGTAWVSEIMKDRVGDILHDGIIAE